MLVNLASSLAILDALRLLDALGSPLTSSLAISLVSLDALRYLGPPTSLLVNLASLLAILDALHLLDALGSPLTSSLASSSASSLVSLDTNVLHSFLALNLTKTIILRFSRASNFFSKIIRLTVVST